MSNSNGTFNTIIYGMTEAVVLIGVVGNILTLVIFSRPTFRKNSISIYCGSLAVLDSFIVFQIVVYIFLLLYNYYIGMSSDAMCKLANYLRYGFSSMSGWVLIAFSIDKVLSLKRVCQSMKKPLLHWMIVIGIVLGNLLLYIEIPIFITLFPVKYYGRTVMLCDPSTLSFANVLNIVFIVEGSLLPFVIMIVMSLVTIKVLRDSRRQVKMVGAVADKRKGRETKYAITSITFNVLFIVLKMPFVISIAIGYVVVNNYLVQISSFLFFLYFSIGFFVHFASNSLFRKEFFILIRIRKPHAGSIMTQSNQPTNRIKVMTKNPVRIEI